MEKGGSMTKAGLILKAIVLDIEAANSQNSAITPIDRILQKIYKLDQPGREHFQSYMRHKWRLKHKPSTLRTAQDVASTTSWTRHRFRFSEPISFE
jgi:hypothetical protein